MQLLRKKVLNFIREHGLFTPGEKVIVAFSGGADSMALLDILANLPDFPLELVLAHMNHQLRGDESDGDELFARSVAGKFALQLEISRVDVAAFAQAKGLSLEEAGREARRSFFLKVAKKHSADAVALGHHRDDQAETVLMRLVRGAAGSGLTGICPKKSDSVFVRPLLCLERAGIEAYLRKGALLWREDSSNSDIKFLRNRIRHELLPQLRSYNPGIVELLNQTAQALAADEELLDLIAGRAFSSMVLSSPAEVRINLDMLLNEPQALRKRLYRKAIAAFKGDLKRISAQHLADIDRLAVGGKGSGRLSLPAGVIVVREYSSLLLTAMPAAPVIYPGEISVDRCDSYPLQFGGSFSVESAAALPPDWLQAGQYSMFLDLNQFPFPWTIRCFCEGDRFTPLGMKGRKKLKDLFIDRKIPLAGRKKIPLLLCGDEIIWVGGVQVSEKARITGAGEELLLLRISLGEAQERH